MTMTRYSIAGSGVREFNCEVLSREVGLQVRWSLAGDSAIFDITDYGQPWSV